MTLFYSPGACSLAPHILLCESGLKFEAVPVDLRAKTYAGGDFTKINPKGQVPTLRLDDGEILTESAVTLQYIADQKPEADLLPKVGARERWRALEWLNFIATELHKGFSPLFSKPSADVREATLLKLGKKLAYVEERLTQDYLLGARFSAPDAYLFTVACWSDRTGVDLAPYPRLRQFIQRMRERPGVRQAMQAESL